MSKQLEKFGALLERSRCGTCERDNVLVAVFDTAPGVKSPGLSDERVTLCADCLVDLANAVCFGDI